MAITSRQLSFVSLVISVIILILSVTGLVTLNWTVLFKGDLLTPYPSCTVDITIGLGLTHQYTKTNYADLCGFGDANDINVFNCDNLSNSDCDHLHNSLWGTVIGVVFVSLLFILQVFNRFLGGMPDLSRQVNIASALSCAACAISFLVAIGAWDSLEGIT